MAYKVITNYSTTLSSSMTSSQNTIPVSSILTNDGHTIAMADLGSIGFLVIEPGSTNEEIVSFTGVNGSTFTGVTRGLAYYGASLSAVPANEFAHQAGSKVIMSNVHYVYEEFVALDGDQTIAGIKTLSSSPIVPTPTTDYQASTKEYVDASISTEDTAIKALPPTTWRPVHSGTFASGANSYVMTDATVTANSIVDVYAQSTPVGLWKVVSTGGSFTIFSSAVETVNVAFKYFINNF
jgi:hypothetical protein